MQHNDFDDGQILHAVTRFCKVTEEGPVEFLFDSTIPTNNAGNDKDVAVGGDENEEREIPSFMNEDASSFRVQGFSDDNDNEPAPKNIPTPANTVNDGMYRIWGSKPLDARRVVGVSADASMHTVLGFFLHFLPLEYFKKKAIL
ncbi:hypothetical protein MHU86_3445 [Fragilaria crotonensis]|nr:hypothetical protein MHU86_3445 [Fragilaria crotonensis]